MPQDMKSQTAPSLARSILLADIRSRPLPFGFGAEHASYGFPLWAVYLRSDGALFIEGAPLAESSSLETLPLWALAFLSEDGLSGDDLFRAVLAGPLQGSMPIEAIEDAEAWKALEESAA